MPFICFSFLVSLLFSFNYSASIRIPLITSNYNNKRITDTLFPLRKTKQVSSKISFSDNFNFNICVLIGNPPQKLILSLSTKDPYTWIKGYKAYNNTKSETSQSFPTNLTYLRQFNINGTLTIDDISMEDLTLKNFSFLTINDQISFEEDGILGLGKQDQNHLSMNFIEVLYQKQLISAKVFYIDCGKGNGNKCLLVLGEYPARTELKQNQHYFHKHELLSNSKESSLTYLSTTLSGVFIQGQDHIWKIDKPVAFSYGSNSIYIPWDFFEYLETVFFKEEIQSKACSITNTDYFTYFVCKSMLLSPKPSLNFILKTWTYTLNFNDYSLGDSIYKLIAFIKNNKFNGWSFGFPFFKKYLTVFDIQKNICGIYYNPKEIS